MYKTTKSAFTMIELILVIVILGIVASIGSQIIVQVYDGYITQRAVHRSSTKTELAALQLANRLTYSIPGTVIARKGSIFEAIEYSSEDNATLEWIGYDADGFEAITADTALGRRPIWSGYCDVDSSTKDSIITPASRLSKLDATISYLRPDGSTTSISDAALFFPLDIDIAHQVGYDETTIGTSAVEPISTISGDETITLDTKTTRTIKEHYKLAWTAYAIVPSNPHTMSGTTGIVHDLNLWYDYQPWDGESYSDGKSFTLIRNVSVFRFTGTGNTIRFKICQRENIGDGFTINTCKEKAVTR